MTVYSVLGSCGWKRAARKLLPPWTPGRSGRSTVLANSNAMTGVSFFLPAAFSLVEGVLGLGKVYTSRLIVVATTN